MKLFRRRRHWPSQGRKVPSGAWTEVAPGVELWHNAGSATVVLARWKP